MVLMGGCLVESVVCINAIDSKCTTQVGGVRLVVPLAKGSLQGAFINTLPDGEPPHVPVEV